MRIVFTAWAWPSHLHAMVPLAWACRIRGHEVVVASQPELLGAIVAAGLPAAPVGRDVDAVAVFRAIASDAAAPPGAKAGGPRVLGLLGALAEAMTEDLIAFARDWSADLMVFEPTALAGPLAAAALDLAAVRHLYGIDLMSTAGRFLPALLGPLCGKLGLASVDPFGLVSVDPCPASLQVPVLGSRRLPVRYVPHGAQGRMSPKLARPARPRVCITWGTTLSRLGPEFFLAGQVARAAASAAADVVAAITPAQRALLGPLPPGVAIVESAPLHLLLPECDLVVAHGGAGTSLTALASELPQLLIPRLPDHVRHAERLAQAGAGLVLPPSASGPDIRDAITELLVTPSYRVQARRLRHAMERQPPPCCLVSELEALAAATRSRTRDSTRQGSG